MRFEVRKLKIQNESQFKKLEPIWKQLERGQDMTVFQSYKWNELLYEEWSRSKYQKLFCSLEVYFLSENSEVKLLVPLLVQRKSTRNKWFGREKGIYILGHGSYSDYLNVIYDFSEESMFECLIDTIQRDYPHIPCIFTDIRENTYFCRFFETKGMVPANVTVSVSVKKLEDEEAYTSSLSKHTRQNLRTALNRMKKDGMEYELRTYDTIHDPDLLDALRRVHVKRMQEKNASSIDILHKISAWIRILVRTYREYNNNIIYSSMQNMEQSCLVMVLINSQVAGYLYGLKDGSVIRIMQNCVDEQFKYYSPMFRGTYDFLVQCYRDSTLSEVDFTRGNEDYKYRLGGEESKLYKYVI